MHAHVLYVQASHAPNLNYLPHTKFFGFHSLSFVSSPLAEDGPARGEAEADASSLLCLLGGGPGQFILLS